MKPGYTIDMNSICPANIKNGFIAVYNWNEINQVSNLWYSDITIIHNIKELVAIFKIKSK